MKRFESLRFKCETITSTLAAVALACGGVAFSQPTITDLGTFPGGQVFALGSEGFRGLGLLLRRKRFARAEPGEGEPHRGHGGP